MKLRFKNILVIQNAQSDSTRAIKLAVSLATDSGGKVKVVDFIKKPTWIWRELVDFDAMMDLEVDARAEAIHSLIAKAKIDVERIDVEILEGRPITEIVRRVIRGNHDLVIKDALAESAEIFFGSLDMRLLRYCPTPVLLTRPNFHGSFQKILAAVDPEANPTGINLNDEIIRQASAMARLRSAELHVVSAWRSPQFNFDNSEANIERHEKLKKQVEHHASDNLKAILDRSLKHVDPTGIHFLNMDPQEAIVQVVNEIKPDLLVMGSQARIGIPGILIGNTAEKVIRQADCAVMTMKPEGFESPIKV